MARRDPRIALLVELVTQAFTAPSWHGTPLWGSLRGVNHRQALWRPGPGRHSIWELTLHTANWKCVVRRRLLRDPAIVFPRPGSDWPGLPDRPTAAAWRRDRALLKVEHDRLIRTLRALDPRLLGRRGWRSKWTNLEHVYGIASHDVYHAGQIQLIKRLSRKQAG